MLGGGFTFSQVPHATLPRSTFNRTHGHKTTFDAGYLIPFYVDEVLPGDTFAVNASLFARLATPLKALMDNIYLDVFYFYVPNRLLWTNWVKMMGERLSPADSIDYSVPVLDDPGAGGFALHSVADYFGIPTGDIGTRPRPTALHFRAYNLIYNEWFRDENLQTPALVPVNDGPDAPALFALRRRGKRHDYFTSCLPYPQKTSSAVLLPLGATAPVKTFAGDAMAGAQTSLKMRNAADGTYVGGANYFGLQAGTGQVMNTSTQPTIGGVSFYPSNLQADLSAATAATINALREAFQIQRLLERDARGGTRYTELLRAHFGVVSPDFRLQRPEFLGGGTVPVHINPVVQTSATAAGQSPQGHLASFGVAAGQNLGFTKSFTEHGVLVGLVEARADLSYDRGLHRMWSRRTRYDYYWPSFANLGEQAVLNKEIFFQGAAADTAVFGYQERWAEYRYMPSKVTGLFRTNAAGTLSSWHLTQELAALPTLGTTFIQDDPPIDRVIAVPAEPHFLLDSQIHVRSTRCMPTYSVPGLIDHF